MKRIVCPVQLIVRGPILTKSSAIGTFGVDAVMAKGTFVDTASGATVEKFYIPGSLVKGLIREAWQELNATDSAFEGYLLRWMGNESPRNSHDEPVRATLFFSDFADTETDAAARQPVRYRIQISEETGAARAKMLQVMESPYASGQEVTFRGEFRIFLGDAEEPDELMDAMLRALYWIRASGGSRSAGFGEILRAQMGTPARQTLPAPSMTSTRWSIRLKFSQPVIFSKRRIADNFFESGDIIAGAALKGAIADMIRVEPAAFQELQSELSSVGISHAFPVRAGASRPEHWPLSLLSFDRQADPVDVIRRRDCFVREVAGVPRAGDFDIDWKDEVKATVRTRFGWPKLKTELRVRTAIDGEIRTAEENKLFAWQMILPQGTEWIAEVDASALSPKARAQLESLLRFGVEPLGKTKACAVMSLADANKPSVPSCREYILTLQTSALLIDPGRHLARNGDIGSSSREDLRREYEDVWNDLSDGSLKLENYFQRCSLAGGEYFRRRFLKPTARYKPYLLTDAGSTFLLTVVEGRDAEALRHVNGWLQSRVPLSSRVRQFYEIPEEQGQRWKFCPYLPENGYGEITINQKSPYREA